MLFARRPPDSLSQKRVIPCVLALVTACEGLALVGCRNWDFYDPRLGTGSTGSGATTGSGGSNATTGATSTTTTSSTSSTGTTMPKCGGTKVLTYDFPGSDPNGIWNQSSKGGATLAETAGQLVVTLPNSAMSSYAAYSTNRYYNLQSEWVSVEVPTVPNPATTAAAVFSVQPGGGTGDYIQFAAEKGNLAVAKHIAGTYTTLKSAPYDAANHKYWRLRETNGVTYFDTSADGSAWSVFTQAPTSSLFGMTLVEVTLSAATSGGEVNPGTAAFAAVNGGGPANEKWCPVGTISDAFAAAARANIWYRSAVTAPETMSQGGGALTFALAANGIASGSYHSSASYDLTLGSAFVHAPVVPNTAMSGQIVFGLYGPGNNNIVFVEGHGTLYLRYNLAGVKSDVTLLYDPAMYAWWRLKNLGAAVHWDTSADGKTWTTQRTAPLPFAIDDLDVVLSGSTYLAEATPGSAQFSSFNIAPP